MFGVELLAADSITALYCFSWLLKISLALASSASSAASLSHLLPSCVSQGTLASKEVHQHAPWGLGQKTFLHEDKGKESRCGVALHGDISTTQQSEGAGLSTHSSLVPHSG